MPYETILYEPGDGVARITLNRPEKLNAISWQMQEELQQAEDGTGRKDLDEAVVRHVRAEDRRRLRSQRLPAGRAQHIGDLVGVGIGLDIVGHARHHHPVSAELAQVFGRLRGGIRHRVGAGSNGASRAEGRE